MFDLTLFRKPTFGGACIAAFALSASMFSMFLYLTLYLQNGLGLSPLAGRRALPAALAAVLRRRAARGADVGAGADPRSHRGRHGPRRDRPDAHARAFGLLGVDGAAARLHRRRHRRRARQRAAGLDRRQRGPAAARGHGLGHQLDLPAGGHRHRHRGARRALPAHPGQRRDGPARARARRGPRPGPGPVPGPAAHRAYLALFTDGLNDILLVAAIVAFAGAVLSFVLIRGSDFVASQRAAPARGRARAERRWPRPTRVGPRNVRLRAIALARRYPDRSDEAPDRPFPALPRCCSPPPRAPSSRTSARA